MSHTEPDVTRPSTEEAADLPRDVATGLPRDEATEHATDPASTVWFDAATPRDPTETTALSSPATELSSATELSPKTTELPTQTTALSQTRGADPAGTTGAPTSAGLPPAGWAYGSVQDEPWPAPEPAVPAWSSATSAPPAGRRRRGPNSTAIILGLVCLAVAGITIVRQATGVVLHWSTVGPGVIVAAGVVFLLIGALGLVRRER